MSDKRFLARDPLYGITEFFIPADDGGFTIEYKQDEARITALIDRNKSDFNDVTNSDRWGDGKLVARIPGEIYADWKMKGYMDDTVKLKALLNDPAHQFLRVWPGRL